MINIIKIYTSQYFRFSSFWHPNSFILDEDAAYRYLDIYLVFPIIRAPMKRKKPLSNLRRDDMKKKKCSWEISYSKGMRDNDKEYCRTEREYAKKEET